MIKKMIFLGAPGVGKGTLANAINKKYDIIHISTGNIFREEINNQTKLGLKVKNILNSGALVPNEITNAILLKAVEDISSKGKSFILDGYPRTIEQAIFLEEQGIEITDVILLEAHQDILIKRLLNRGRKDDNYEIIKNRNKIYQKETQPLIDFYQKKGIIKTIDSSTDIANILSEFERLFFLNND